MKNGKNKNRTPYVPFQSPRLSRNGSSFGFDTRRSVSAESNRGRDKNRNKGNIEIIQKIKNMMIKVTN